MKLAEAVRDDLALRKDTEVLEAFLSGTVEGMFGPDGMFWKGPRLAKGADGYTEALERIKNAFLIENLVGVIRDNHADAVFGLEPEWTLRQGAKELELPELTTWYRKQSVQRTLYRALLTLLSIAVGDETSSILRVHVPSRALRDGRASRLPLEESLLRYVRLTTPPTYQAGVLREDNDPIAGYYVYGQRIAKEGVRQTQQVLELSAVDTEFAYQNWPSVYAKRPVGNTVVQLRTGADFEELIGEVSYPLGGNLTITEMRRRPFITEDMVSQQAGHNTQHTYLNRHTSAAAFLERVIFNAQRPGRWVNKEGVEGRFSEEEFNVFVPEPLYVGESTTNMLAGVQDSEGRVASPSIHWREPSSSEPILANLRESRKAIYGLGNQMHLMISGDATASGESRVQAVQDFLKSLNPTVDEMQRGVAWTLETPLRLAGHFAGQDFSDVEADVKVNTQGVMPTPDERRLYREEQKDGVYDMLELRRRLGVTNTEEMDDRVKAEKAERVAQQQALFAQQQRTGEQEEREEPTL